MHLNKLRFKIRSLERSIASAFRAFWYRTVRAPLGHISWWAWSRFAVVSNRALSCRNGIRAFQQLTLIEVDPQGITQFVLDEDVQRKFMIWPGDWDLQARPMTEHYRYHLMQDLWQHRDDLSQSQSFHGLMQKLNRGEAVTRINKGQLVTTAEEARQFLESQLDIFHSLKKHGYRPELAQDELNVAIGRGGTLIKANAGRKRLIAAQILGLATMPVRIAYVHQLWLDKHHTPGHRRDQSLQRAIQAAVKLSQEGT